MEINDKKSTLHAMNVGNESMGNLWYALPFQEHFHDEGFRYLGFDLKPNSYVRDD